MSAPITIIGGGVAGLTAAITAAELGATVRLHESHARLGGRGRAIDGPYVAHDGAHVFYADGPHYAWLKERGFVAGLGWPGAADASRARFRHGGTLHRMPSVAMLRAQKARWRTAPVDLDFTTWATDVWGERTAQHAANAVAVVTYDADTGRLSAAFVWHLFQRIYGPRVPGIRWVQGGWQRVIDRMAERATELGVQVTTGSRVDTLPEDGPVIVATDLHEARALLSDDSLTWTGGRAELLDIAVPKSSRDRSLCFDLDEGGLHESYSMQDDSVAPAGESLFQLQLPRRHDEDTATARARLDHFADQVMPGWQERATFTRRSTARERMGANDLPGQTWRDRPAIDRGEGVYLVGDMVAAPGMRGEISINSAAVAGAAAATGRPLDIAAWETS